MSSKIALQQITNLTNNKNPQNSQQQNKLSSPSMHCNDNSDNYHQPGRSEQNVCKEKIIDKSQKQNTQEQNEDSTEEKFARQQKQEKQDTDIQKKQNVKQQSQSIQLSPQLSVIELSRYQFDFLDCMPGSVQEKSFSIKLNYDLQTPASIFVYVHCEDQLLNSLPEYVFGIRRPNSYEYFDEFKFKIAKKSEITFVMGTKVPNLIKQSKGQPFSCQCRLFVWIDGFSSQPLQALLNLTIRAPKIVCPKQLTLQDNIRAIKISAIKNKAKKDCKIPFRVTESFTDGRTLSLQTEVIGIDNIKNNLKPSQQKASKIQDVEVRPKTLSISGNGQFILSFGLNFTQEIKNSLGFEMNQQDQNSQRKKVSYCKVRKVLIIKVINTSCIYHFPIQACFYNDISGKVQSDNE